MDALAPIRFARCLEKAHAFALWHRRKLTAPAKELFYEDWQTFTLKLKTRGDDWSEREWSVMLTYALSALRYDQPTNGATRAEWERGGLWAPQWVRRIGKPRRP
jgi:hypothetical protein